MEAWEYYRNNQEHSNPGNTSLIPENTIGSTSFILGSMFFSRVLLKIEGTIGLTLESQGTTRDLGTIQRAGEEMKVGLRPKALLQPLV